MVEVTCLNMQFKQILFNVGICKCCGGLISISVMDGSVDMACSEMKYHEPCPSLGGKKGDCQLDSMDCFRTQRSIAKLMFYLIEQEYNKVGYVYFSGSVRDMLMLQIYLEEKEWIVGEMKDKGGVFYRGFPNNKAYSKALLRSYKMGHLEEYSQDYLEKEFKRIGSYSQYLEIKKKRRRDIECRS